MDATDPNRLVLGTAQLGMKYGIANSLGQPNINQAMDIISTAWDGGIRHLDTAQSYHRSEEIIGRCLKRLNLVDQVKIASKLPSEFGSQHFSSVPELVSQSLDRLGCSSLSILYLHDEKLLDDWHQGLDEVLNRCVLDGLVEKIGVSVYSPPRCKQALDCDGLDVVQFPTNPFDRRFMPCFARANDQSLPVDIYVRSIFLQGLLLLTPDQVPDTMAFCRPCLRKFRDLCRIFQTDARHLCLGYVREKCPRAMVIFGAETANQVEDNLIFWSEPLDPELSANVDEMFNDMPTEIINPNLWSLRS